MLKLHEKQPDNTNPPTADHPYGVARNVVSDGDGTGTEFDADVLMQYEGAFQAIVSEANIEPNGIPDSTNQSDIVDGIKVIAGNQRGVNRGGYQTLTELLYKSDTVTHNDVDHLGAYTEKYWVVDGTPLPYTIDKVTYPDPDLDPNLEQVDPQVERNRFNINNVAIKADQYYARNYEDRTASRDFGTTYTNTGDRPREVYLTYTAGVRRGVRVTVNGVEILSAGSAGSDTSIRDTVVFTVPVGATYLVEAYIDNTTLIDVDTDSAITYEKWMELVVI